MGRAHFKLRIAEKQSRNMKKRGTKKEKGDPPRLAVFYQK